MRKIRLALAATLAVAFAFSAANPASAYSRREAYDECRGTDSGSVEGDEACCAKHGGEWHTTKYPDGIEIYECWFEDDEDAWGDTRGGSYVKPGSDGGVYEEPAPEPTPSRFESRYDGSYYYQEPAPEPEPTPSTRESRYSGSTSSYRSDW